MSQWKFYFHFMAFYERGFLMYLYLKERFLALLVGIFVICCFPFAALRIVWVCFSNPKKAWNVFKAFDLTGNVLVNGKFNEYISTRAHRAMVESQTWGCVLCKVLNVFDKDHCAKSANPNKPL